METEIKIFEWEILDLIRLQARLSSFPMKPPFCLSYTRAQYEVARGVLIDMKRDTLLGQGKAESDMSAPDRRLPDTVPGWGWK